MLQSVKNDIRRLVEKSGKVYVSSVDEAGYPNTKAMFAREHDGMKIHYMSTNCSSLRVSQFRKNPKACIYYCNERFFKGLMFTGTMEVCTDRETRERIWRRGMKYIILREWMMRITVSCVLQRRRVIIIII